MKKHRKMQEPCVDNPATVENPATEPAEASTADITPPIPAQDEEPAATPLQTSDEEPAGTTCPDSASATACSPADAGDTPDFQEQLRQAYLRGRNEAIEALMQRPGMMQPLAPPPGSTPPEPEPEVMILNNPRTSIWEK